MIRAHGLVRRLGGRAVLDGVDLEAHAGETLAVLGASGSGKSTLLRILHLLDEPDEGDLQIEGAPVPRDEPSRRAARRRIGLVQQSPGLLRASVVENVAFPLRARGVARPEARRVALNRIAEVGLAQQSDADAAALSGGEAQRVALARALATRPDLLLLLDEPTNQLDPPGVRLVEALLARERARGAALVLVTHDARQARRVADRFVFLREGRVVEAGPVTRLEAPETEALREHVALG